MLPLDKGIEFVKIVRKVIEGYFSGEKFEVKDYGEHRGVFVTLHKYPSNELRGCIGFSEPVMDLSKALVESARSAAFSDYRFIPVVKEEMEKIIVEVSVLTKPEIIKNVKEIKVGRDGLIVECNGKKGLLLPIVAIDYKWEVNEFLENTCLKAGLNKTCWKEKDCKIFTFKSQVFSEIKPRGEVVEKK